MSLHVCTHAHLLRERLYHRGRWNDDPVKRVVDLCTECRADFRAADIRLERADGSRWREPRLSVDPQEPTGERNAPSEDPQAPAGCAGGGPEAAAGPTTAAAATDPGGSPVDVDPAVRGTDALTPGDGHPLDEPGHRAMAAQVAPSSPSTGGEEGLPLPVKVEHPVEDEKKTCIADGCDRPVKAKGYCGPHYEKVFRRNGRGRVEKPTAPAAPGDSGGPLAATDAEIRKLEKEISRLRGHLAEVRQTLAPLLGVEETVDTAVSMASRVAKFVARLQAPPSTGRNLDEELAGAVADLEQSDARLRAWELWHQESEGGGNPLLLAGLLRLTRGARA